MKIKIVIALAFVFFVSCKEAIDKTEIQNLNGYWEIEKVIFPDGEDKEYKVSETFDYFEVKGDSGTRKKGMQQFDGTFLSNDVSESFSIEFQDGKCFINYKTDFAKWQEKVLVLTKESLVVVNNSDIEYHYKRPILLEKN